MSSDALAGLIPAAITAIEQSASLDVVAAAAGGVPRVPGLYAVWCRKSRRRDLGPAVQGGTGPLYIGKSESSLRDREVSTHFAAGRSTASKTGSSTVRRSFAALLVDRLGPRAVPRSAVNPGHFDKYSLLPEDDVRLTEWMHSNLQLSVWPWPATDDAVRLVDVERALI